jgi:hypothetical protein
MMKLLLMMMGHVFTKDATDPSALNYDPIANTDNGSCEYCSGEGSVIAQLYVCAYSAGYEMNLDIIDENGVVVYNVSNLADNQIFYADLCLSAGQCYTVNMTNAAGNAGWNNGYFWINTNNMQLINQSLNQNLTMESTIFSIDGTCTAISGCTERQRLPITILQQMRTTAVAFILLFVKMERQWI